MKRSNADRQRAYRDRRRNARNAQATPIPRHSARRRKDFWLNGVEYIYLGDWGNGPQYAKIIQKQADQ